jgi:hypothetical protein
VIISLNYVINLITNVKRQPLPYGCVSPYQRVPVCPFTVHK